MATAVCCTGLGVYIACLASSSLVSNEASYGPFGAVITLITAEIGLGVALHLGAVIGTTTGRGKDQTAARAGPGYQTSRAQHQSGRRDSLGVAVTESEQTGRESDANR